MLEEGASGQQARHPGEPHGHHHRVVKVTVDGVRYELMAGSYLVSKLKVIFGIPPQKELALVERGRLNELSDADRIEVRPGMMFVSHCRAGSSS